MPNNTNTSDNNFNQDLETMYPDIYKKVKPYIDEIVSRYGDGQLSQSMIESMVQDILQRSGLSGYAASDESYESEAIPTQGFMNYGNFFGGLGNPQNQYPNHDNDRRRRRYPMYPVYPIYPTYPIYPRYPGLSPQELVRILLLQRLFGYNPYY